MSEEMVSKDQVKEFIKSMSLMDAAALVKELEDELGVSAAAPMMAMAPGAAAGAGDGGGEAEQTEFDVVLTSPGERKIQVIKAVREITGLGLKEAKDLVDSAPKAIKEGLSKEQADEVQGKIEEAGGAVELK